MFFYLLQFSDPTNTVRINIYVYSEYYLYVVAKRHPSCLRFKVTGMRGALWETVRMGGIRPSTLTLTVGQ